MSLILDALNRSRGDRDAVPTLDSQHFQPGGREGGFRWWIVACAMVLIVAAAWLFWGASKSQPVDAEQSPASVAEPVRPIASAGPGTQSTPSAPAQEPIASTPPQVQPSRAQSAPDQDAVAALYSQPVATTKAADEAPGAAEPVAAAQREDPVPAASEGGSDLEETAVDMAEVLRRAQEELGQPGLSAHPVPVLEDLSQQTKDRIPSVYYSVHDYSADGASSVTINGQRMTPGQRANGFLVREILPDSVVLSWGGTDFRLRALNSWINL